MTARQEACLTAPEILAYLAGELSDARKAQVERHLDECRLCGAAVEGVAGLEWREGFLKSTSSVLAQVRARTARVTLAASAAQRRAPRLRAAQVYLTVAATLVVGVSTTIMLTRPGPGESLFEQAFEPYPSTRPVARGAVDASRSRAMSLYEAGDYRGALAALEEGLRSAPNDPEACFYAGVCQLALGQTREAMLDLEKVLQLGPGDLRAPAEWYLALAHLRGRHPMDAQPYLERIAASDGFYRDRARTLLKELERPGVAR